MPSILNSDDGAVSGTSGLKSTGGNDGLLNIQSNGSTVLAVTGSGIAVTGTMSQTGVSTFAAGTAGAPSITFTGDTNTGIFSSGADTVNFGTGGTERARITSGGFFKASNTGLYVSSTGSYHELDNSTDSRAAYIYNSNASLTTDGVLLVAAERNTTNNTFYALTYYNGGAGAYKFRVADSGAIGTATGISVGSATPPTDGSAGIKFPAAQSASSNANTLDDYEEGTWTPTLTTDGVDFTSVSYSLQNGDYTKVGNICYVRGKLRTSAVTVGSASGFVQIGGLPFTASGSENAINCAYAVNWAGEEPLNGLTQGGSTTKIYLYYRSSVDGNSQTTAVADVGTGAFANELYFSGTYTVA